MLNIYKVGGLVKLEITEDAIHGTKNLFKDRRGKVEVRPTNDDGLIHVQVDDFNMQLELLQDLSIDGTPVVGIADLEARLPEVFPEEGGGSSTPSEPQDLQSVLDKGNIASEISIELNTKNDDNSFIVRDFSGENVKALIGVDPDGNALMLVDGKNVIRSVNGFQADNAGNLNLFEEGVWTPELTILGGNISAVATSYGNYLRVGNTVTVWGKFNIVTNNTAGQSTFSMSLPIATTFADDHTGAGTMFGIGGGVAIGGSIQSYAVDGTLACTFLNPASAGLGRDFRFHASYTMAT